MRQTIPRRTPTRYFKSLRDIIIITIIIIIVIIIIIFIIIIIITVIILIARDKFASR